RPGGQNPRADNNAEPSDAPTDSPSSCDDGYHCTSDGSSTACTCTKCEAGFHAVKGTCVPKGNNGVGNGVDPQPPGNPPINDGPGTSPGDPGNKQHSHNGNGRP